MIFMKYVFTALITGLVIMLAMLVNLYISFTGPQAEPSAERPFYHIAVITQESNDPFWTNFKIGATEAGRDLNLFVEFMDLSHNDPTSTAEMVDKAILAEVDAIAIQPNDIKMTEETIQKAVDAGITVLTFESDVFNIPNIPTVGSNSYEIGTMLGDMAVKASGGAANVAILINDSGADHNNQFNNIKLQGILESFKNYSLMNVSQYTLDANLFEAEKLTSSILSESPEINMIICTDELSTPGVAQVLIDADKVGQIKVIGYGTMPQTMNYIERGVIYGTICPDSKAIGYNCISQLYDMLQKKESSEVVHTDVYAFTLDNLDEYEQIFSADGATEGR